MKTIALSGKHICANHSKCSITNNNKTPDYVLASAGTSPVLSTAIEHQNIEKHSIQCSNSESSMHITLQRTHTKQKQFPLVFHMAIFYSKLLQRQFNELRESRRYKKKKQQQQ